jgi:YfiH family protein
MGPPEHIGPAAERRERLLRQDNAGLVTYRFESLPTEGLSHAVFTRLGGVSQGPFATLNVGHTVGDDPAAVAQNHARIYAHLHLDARQVVTPHQVHGNHVALVSDQDSGQALPNTDGLATDQPQVAFLLRFADCQPILLYDPEHQALALVHAGWRGLAQGIARRAVETMQAAFGSQPQALVAGLGPAIGPCCYTVGQNVAAAMGYALADWQQVMLPLGEDTWRLDLPAANAQQLAAVGVQAIEQAHLCTACHNDEFYSHRAEQGVTGRFAVVAHLSTRGKRPGRKKQRISRATSRPVQPNGAGSDVDSLVPPGLPTFSEALEEKQ